MAEVWQQMCNKLQLRQFLTNLKLNYTPTLANSYKTQAEYIKQRNQTMDIVSNKYRNCNITAS